MMGKILVWLQERIKLWTKQACADYVDCSPEFDG